MEWLLDPAAWVGLLTLVVLEIVLGIDTLIFIAILADKLPPSQRDRARILGLSLALVMRLGLLSVMSWLVTLTTPLFSIGPLSPSGRDLILILGGLFLWFMVSFMSGQQPGGMNNRMMDFGKSRATMVKESNFIKMEHYYLILILLMINLKVMENLLRIMEIII